MVEVVSVIEGVYYRLYDYDLWIDLGVATGIFLLFLLLRKIFTRYIFNLVLRITKKTSTSVDEYIVTAYQKPMRAFIWILGLYLALMYLPLGVTANHFISQVFSSVIIILIAWGLFILTNTSSTWMEKIGERFELQIDRILLPFISKTLRFLIIALAITIIAEDWGYNISSLVAGLGLGGLAFALAAKDYVGNLFGGVVILTEKPFSLGDWIKTPSVEGTVEDITFRSTRVRTFAQAVVTLPNSTLANEPITNWSRMGKRRITFHLGVEYGTPREKLEKCVNDIRTMLENHPEIHQETLFVHFDRFNDSSLDIFLYFFTKTTNWGEWLRVKEDCNFKIMEILEKEGVSVAFPSRSIYFETPLEKKVDQDDKGAYPDEPGRPE